MTDPTTALGWTSELITLWGDLPTGLQLLVTAGVMASISVGIFRKILRFAR
jgi:hypothetical protein